MCLSRKDITAQTDFQMKRPVFFLLHQEVLSHEQRLVKSFKTVCS